ncbi:MAG: HEAT repeat domain-containing protein [Luteolibacter sp.]
MNIKKEKFIVTHMQNKSKLFLICFVFFASSVCGLSKEEVLNKEQILELIPKSHGTLDLTERENLLQLIAAVDSVYPVLCEELLSTDNTRTQAYILAILGKTQKNKHLVLPAIREYMIRHKDDDPQPDSMFTGIKTLGKIGGPEDAELLSHFLNIGFESSRVVAAQAIKEIESNENAQERDEKRLKRVSEAAGTNDSEKVDEKSRPPAPSWSAEDLTNSTTYWLPFVFTALVAGFFVLKVFKRFFRKTEDN